MRSKPKRAYNQGADTPGRVSCPHCTQGQVDMTMHSRCKACGAEVVRVESHDFERAVWMIPGESE